MTLDCFTLANICDNEMDGPYYLKEQVDNILAQKDDELEHLNDVICSLNERIAEYEGSDLR